MAKQVPLIEKTATLNAATSVSASVFLIAGFNLIQEGRVWEGLAVVAAGFAIRYLYEKI